MKPPTPDHLETATVTKMPGICWPGKRIIHECKFRQFVGPRVFQSDFRGLGDSLYSSTTISAAIEPPSCSGLPAMEKGYSGSMDESLNVYGLVNELPLTAV